MKKKKPSTSWLGVPESDDPLNAQTAAVRLLAQALAALLGVMHLGFMGVFHATGIGSLALASGLGALACALSLILLSRQQIGAGWTLTVGAMVAHATLCLTVLGWSSGFQYFVVLGVPLLMAGPVRPFALKAGLSTALVLGYVLLDMLSREHATTSPMLHELQEVLHYFNVASALMMALMVAAYAACLFQESTQALRRWMTVDSLTGVRHRCVFAEVAAAENVQGKGPSPNLCVVLCHVEGMRHINATQGQQAGDAVLRAVGGVMVKGVRGADTMLRWGGNEFLAILPNTDLAGAKVVAERLQRGVAALEVPAGRQRLPVRMTLAVAARRPMERLDAVVAQAEAAVHDGEQAGGQRLVYANEEAVAAVAQAALA